ELAAEFGQAAGSVGDLEAGRDAALLVHDAHGMRGAAPIKAGEVRHSFLLLDGSSLGPVGRSGGSLIVRRSGRPPVARQPVARLDLLAPPAPPARRVSRGPASGERRGPSPRATGRRSQAP